MRRGHSKIEVRIEGGGDSGKSCRYDVIADFLYAVSFGGAHNGLPANPVSVNNVSGRATCKIMPLSVTISNAPVMLRDRCAHPRP